MIFTRLILTVSCAALCTLGAQAAPPPRPVPVAYTAPAGNLPAGHVRGATFDAVLPSGRLITPFGESVVLGIDALGVALSPDGRYAIVSCGDAGGADLQSLVDPTATGGHVLAVVDTATMRIVGRYRAPGETYWLGITALPDPLAASRTLVLASGGPTSVVYAFTLDVEGQLRPDRRHAIAIPSPADPGLVSVGHASPGMLVATRDGRRVYVVNQTAATVAAIDPRSRSLTGPVRPVGFAPFGAAISVDRLLVSDEGLMQYADLAHTAPVPTFRVPPADPQRASALSLVGLAPNGDISALASDAPPFLPASVPMDPGPDGARIVGGAHPTAIAATPDGAYAFVAMSGVDRIATVALDGTPRVVGGTELRLFDRGPVRHAASRAGAIARRLASVRRARWDRRHRGHRRARSRASAPARLDSDGLVSDGDEPGRGRPHAVRREHQRLRSRSAARRADSDRGKLVDARTHRFGQRAPRECDAPCAREHAARRARDTALSACAHARGRHPRRKQNVRRNDRRPRRTRWRSRASALRPRHHAQPPRAGAAIRARDELLF